MYFIKILYVLIYSFEGLRGEAFLIRRWFIKLLQLLYEKNAGIFGNIIGINISVSSLKLILVVEV